MGLFEKIFGNRPKESGQYQGSFQMLDGYRPQFSSWNKDIYESELIRAAIGARATHISKLRVQTQGAARPVLQRKLTHGPNDIQTWGQFLYRLSTILDNNNTAFIVPIYDQYGDMSGVYAPLAERCDVVQYGDTPYLKYHFSDGKEAAIEMSLCGVMTKYQYRSDFFGETNGALRPTLELVNIQNQGISEAVKSSAHYRFMATLNNFSKDEDLKKERERFSKTNLSAEANGGGLLLFPNTYANIQQIKSSPYTADADQMELIKASVFEYFNVNEDILQAKAFGDSWSAFYESVVESFAIQFSDVMSRMIFSPRELTEGNLVMATANRLQYMTNADKLNVSNGMLDRGIMSINEVREIWNLAPVEGGDVRVIRGEYYNAEDKTE